MPIEIKKVVIDDKTYKIKQHPATEGCKLIEQYASALRVFAISQETRYVQNAEIIPFVARLDGEFLALLMFMDRVANPSAEFEVYTSPSKNPKSQYLTIKEIKEGKTLEDRETSAAQEDSTPTPLSYALDYQATAKQEASTDVNSVFEQFFKYITFEGEPVELDNLTFHEMAAMLNAFIEHNMLHIWTRERWSLPDNYNSGGISPPQSLAKAAAGFSQSNIIYSVLNSELKLATYAELVTTLNVCDAYDMNEQAMRQYYDSCEMRKESERQARNNQ